MNHTVKKLICLALTLALLTGVAPETMAAEPDNTEIPVSVEETVADDAAGQTPAPASTAGPELPCETETAGTPDCTEEPAPEPAETPAVTAEEEPDAAEEESDNPAEETVGESVGEECPEAGGDSPAENALIYGFAGMPEGIPLPAEEAARKQALSAYGVPGALADMIPGTDYSADTILCAAETEAYAQAVAAAYCGELLRCEAGIAVIRLLEHSVLQAVEAGLAEERLPAAEPDYYVSLLSTDAPCIALDWESIVGAGDNPDPLLEDPSAEWYQWYHGMIDSYTAWEATTGSPAVRVAVIDTGVSAVEDLPAPECYDVTGEDCLYDVNGHGTHVAGVIAARLNNGVAGAGVAPGVSIVSVRILSATGGGSYSNIILGIRKATALGVDIMNLSTGGYVYSTLMQDAVDEAYAAGVTVIAAAGNNGSDIKLYPAALNHVISVAAVNQSGKRAAFSNFGAWVDIAAPGQGIYSLNTTGETAVKNGTSQASPMVAGAAALYMSLAGHVKPDEMERVLLGAVTAGPANLGAGILNVGAMFHVPAEPVFTVTDAEGVPLAAHAGLYTVPADAVISITGDVFTGTLIYTTDGTKPVAPGKGANGICYTGAISAGSFTPGVTYTINAVGVSGAGVGGKAGTIRLLVQRPGAVSVTIRGTESLYVGKSATYKATVLPEGAQQKVVWSVVSSDCGASIDASTGVLTIKRAGQAVIRAAAAENSGVYGEFAVSATAVQEIAKLKLRKGDVIWRSYAKGSAVPYQIQYTAYDANGAVIENPAVVFTSSDKSVATVDATGNVLCLKPGTVTITVKAADRSISAKLQLTVQKGVTSVSLNGALAVNRGGKTVYTVTPHGGGASRISWSLEDNTAGATINSGGVVTVPTKAEIGSSFTVAAKVTDGVKTYRMTQSVTVERKTKYLAVDASFTGETDYNSTMYSPVRIVRRSSGYLSKVYLLTADIPGFEGDERSLQLTAATDSAVPVLWKSSNTKVATVDEDGLLTAVAPGTATITCTTQDSVPRSTRITVTVTRPCSSVTVTHACYSASEDIAYVVPGGVCISRAALGNAFGTPTKSTVTWNYTVLDSNGADVTRTYARYITQKNGKITLSGKLRAYTGEGLTIVVTATAADRTGYSGSVKYLLVPAATVLKTDTMGLSLAVQPGKDYSTYVWLDTDCEPNALSVQSSNPDVAAAYVIRARYNTERRQSMPCLCVYSGTVPGTAVLTVTANDGSKLTATVTVTVR